MNHPYDLVVRGGAILDGRGGPAVNADVAIKDGRIAAVGIGLAQGTEELNAAGKLVTPGFVDIHTHYDGQATWESFLAPSSLHGVTTAVMGNCGVGFAPVKPEDRQSLIELMEGVEDIPGTALHEGLKWTWSSFPEYLDALEEVPHDIDLCAQLPHAALRLFVMGDRALRHELATQEDIARMRALVADAIRAGAIGVSSSRTMLHRSINGDLTPSIVAAEEELMGIALGIRDAGSGVLETISDWRDARVNDFSMFRRIVEQSGVPLSLSLLQEPDHPHRWREVLTELERARADGLPMIGQVAPRAIGLIMNLESSLSPFVESKSYQSLKPLTRVEKLRRLRDPDFRSRVLLEARQADANPDIRPSKVRMFNLVYLLVDPIDYEPSKAMSVQDLACASGVTGYEYVYDKLIEGDAFYVTLFNYADGNYEVCREMLASEATVLGLSDAGAHVAQICDASFTTYLLSYWGRDRPHGRFDLGWLVKRITADSARAVGLQDRGIIDVGMKADLNVIDFDALAIGQPYLVDDLPAGGRRFMQSAAGYDATIVSGVIIQRNGESTGATPGRLVRGSMPVTV